MTAYAIDYNGLFHPLFNNPCLTLPLNISGVFTISKFTIQLNSLEIRVKIDNLDIIESSTITIDKSLKFNICDWICENRP